ncbi:putative cyclin-F2-1 [Panicum miliaceum]|uniref:Cyclin-F2-1 n=1 Tax=Panicum miliaceum TaxID=4540 RepID=A0A3L6RQJ6_PANMI|nr:putative cyclin-F2-1 [Panicum miliaceum]
MATHVKAAPAGYRYYGDEDDIDALLRDIHAAVGAGFASVPTDSHRDAAPTTPVAVLRAPRSYGDDTAERDAVTIKTPPPEKRPQQEQCGSEYDADIDATLRAMERDPAERPSADYLAADTQAEEELIVAARAHVVTLMYNFSGYYNLAPGTLHRAVSYVDCFLSASVAGGNLVLLGAVAVFTAAKYKDRSTTLALRADDVARHVGCAARDVVAAERALFAALGYRLSGPTAYTFVDHFTRHGQEEEGADDGSLLMLRTLAHHLADLALLDCRCGARFLPSAVAASAIALARMAMVGSAAPPPWSEEEVKVTGYELEDLAGCMAMIYDIHKHPEAWPGCDHMMEDCKLIYALPPLVF